MQRSYFALASPCLLYLRLSVVLTKQQVFISFETTSPIQLRAVVEHDLILLNPLAESDD